MFELISGTLFSISANIDNIPIGLSYGVRKIHISLIKNIFICAITSIVTFLSMLVGQNISKFFDVKTTNILGSILLILLGVYPIIKNIFSKKKFDKLNNNNNINIVKNNNDINLKELLIMIITLSLNNIAAGIAASIAGVNIICTTIFTFIFCVVFLYIGNNLGKKINNRLIEKYSEFISSFILILIGIIELFI